MSVESLSDPLFPIASRAVRRAQAAAEAIGVVCVPYTWDMKVPETANGTTLFNFNQEVPTAMGPVAVVDVVPPRAKSLAQVKVKQDSAFLTDGVITVGDAFVVPRLYAGRLMSSPMLFAPGAQIQFQSDLTAAGLTWATGEGYRINALGIRKRVAGGKSLGPASDAEGVAWLKALGDDGVFWATGIFSDKGTAYQTTSGDVVVEAVVVAVGVNDVEGFSAPDNMRVAIGDQFMTPMAFDPRLGATVVDDGSAATYRVTMLPGLRYPVPSKTRVQVDQVSYPADTSTRIPYRVTLLGRRGGIAAACWA